MCFGRCVYVLVQSVCVLSISLFFFSFFWISFFYILGTFFINIETKDDRITADNVEKKSKGSSILKNVILKRILHEFLMLLIHFVHCCGFIEKKPFHINLFDLGTFLNTRNVTLAQHCEKIHFEPVKQFNDLFNKYCYT